MMKSITITAQAFAAGLSKLPAILAQNWGLLLILFFCLETPRQLLTQYDALFPAATIENSQHKIISQAGVFLLDIIRSGLLLVFICLFLKQSQNSQSETQWQKKNILLFKKIQEVIIETLRSMGSVVRRSLLLIIPGVHRHLRLQLVPLVVLISPAYESGECDALKESSQLLKGFVIPVLVITILIFIFPSLLITSDQVLLIHQKPFLTLLEAGLRWSTEVLHTSFLFCLYIQLSRSQGEMHGSH